MGNNIKRAIFLIKGQVQGVGFRPFIWRLANEENLTGNVLNTSKGVRIEAQGASENIAIFEKRLLAELPPLAKISHMEKKKASPKPAETAFSILQSEAQAGQNVLVSPDVAICADCLADIRQPGNARYQYPFANCTNCGPRFSITKSLPYDRPATTMACFPLCPMCQKEYTDPANRRFHAQPIACPECGPFVWHVGKRDYLAGNTRPNAENRKDAIAKTGRMLLAGGIVAIRGLGGFQLACDATNSAAVAELRNRKNRPHKALAVMARDINAARLFCDIGPEQAALLTGNRKPIVLCPFKADSPLAASLSPDTVNIGLMLPYTPLHALLLDWLAANGPAEPLLVMTSANARGEPICLGNREALERLEHLAGAWLLHNRDILCRVDDSVAAIQEQGPVFLRRARGYTPEPVATGIDSPPILGAGGQLKATFCLTRGDCAFLSQHIGDLDSPASLAFYEEALAHMQKLLEVTPAAIIHDRHPDFLSSQFARDLAAKLNIRAIALQHHAAHAVACMADNGYYGQCLALCLDGSGLGDDGTIWGGELLFVDPAKPAYERLGSLSPFPMPGGEAAIYEPWRLAAALAWQNKISLNPQDQKYAMIAEMLSRQINCPLTSSCGRLFDAIASLLGYCDKITYEGQAAMRLEKEALLWAKSNNAEKCPDFGLIACGYEPGLYRLDSAGIFGKAWGLAQSGMGHGAIAYGFHDAIAKGFAVMAEKAAQKTGIYKIALSGGVMQNSLIAELLPSYLRQRGLEPLTHRQAPPGDGGLALGQAFWGQWLYEKNLL